MSDVTRRIIGYAPPDMAGDVPAGFVAVVVDAFEGEGWRPPTDAERDRLGCRWTLGPGHFTCRAEPVAMLARGYRDRVQWWAYCRDHLYGRRLDDTGRLLQRVLIPTEEQP